MGLVRKGGFEPPRSCERQPLKLVRLPVPPLSRDLMVPCFGLTEANIVAAATSGSRPASAAASSAAAGAPAPAGRDWLPDWQVASAPAVVPAPPCRASAFRIRAGRE